jgi:hypothetical protein
MGNTAQGGQTHLLKVALSGCDVAPVEVVFGEAEVEQELDCNADMHGVVSLVCGIMRPARARLSPTSWRLNKQLLCIGRLAYRS